MPRLTGLPVAANVGSADLVVIVQANITKRATVLQIVSNGNVAGNFGNLTVNGILTVVGNSNLSANANVGGVLTVIGNANLSANANVGGILTVLGNANLSANATVGGNLTVSGNSNVTLNQIVTGNQTVTGNQVVAGTSGLLVSAGLLTAGAGLTVSTMALIVTAANVQHAIGGAAAATGTLTLPGGGTVVGSNGATLWITAPSTGASTNYALFVEAGSVLLNGAVLLNGIGTTGSAANLFADNGASNNVLRFTSSLRYKKNVQPLSMKEAEHIVFKSGPITFTHIGDGRDYVGLSAENIADTDARFTTFDEQGRPDGVQYSHFVSPLILIAKDHRNTIKELERRLSALERKR